MATQAKSFSLRENIRQRILKEMIANLKDKFRSVTDFLMVIDSLTMKIIASSVRTVELLEEGVLAIEKLDLQRKPFPETHAIYFVAPTEHSINTIIKDFDKPNEPQYGNVHLFFTNQVPVQLFDKLKSQKALLERVLTFKELNLDFLTPEPNVFHFDMPEALPVVFSKQGHPEAKAEEENIAQKLATVMLNLTRFDKFSVMYNKNTQNQVSERVATAVKNRLETFFNNKKKNSKDDDDDDDEHAPVKLVILDRTVDPLTPALMDYYYESMVFEFFNVKGNIVEYDDENKGQVVKKKAILDDKDELWEKHKYQFIVDAMLSISAEYEDFVKKNVNIDVQGNSGEGVDIHKMAETLKKLPMSQELLEKYQLHMTLIDQIIQIFKKKHLKEVGDLEQTLATSVDSQGVELKNQQLTTLLATKKTQLKLDPEAEIRLMIITSFVLKLNASERKLLTQTLPKEGKDILSKLTWLGLSSEKTLIKGKVNEKMKEKPNLQGDKQKNIPGNLCRYIPSIESLASDIVANKIGDKLFGTLSYPSSFNGSLGAKVNVNRRDIDMSKLPKLVFFVIGGMTHSEVRVLSEVGAANRHINVIAGSTALINVKDYIRGIGKMHSTGGAQEVDLVEDDDDLENSRDF